MTEAAVSFRNPRQVLITTLVLQTVIIAADQVSQGNTPKPRQFVATGAVYTILSLFLPVAPQLVASLGVLVFVTSMLTRGVGTVERVFNIKPGAIPAGIGLPIDLPDFVAPPTDTGVGGNNPPPTGGGGTGTEKATALAFWKAAQRQFPGKLTNVGITSRRGADNCSNPGSASCPWSQHAYGNAIDISADAAIMQKLFDWAMQNHAALRVRSVIYNGRIWQAGYGVSSFGGSPHTDHVHTDFKPKYCGTPAPSGGGGNPC